MYVALMWKLQWFIALNLEVAKFIRVTNEVEVQQGRRGTGRGDSSLYTIITTWKITAEILYLVLFYLSFIHLSNDKASNFEQNTFQNISPLRCEICFERQGRTIIIMADFHVFTLLLIYRPDGAWNYNSRRGKYTAIQKKRLNVDECKKIYFRLPSILNLLAPYLKLLTRK